MLMIRDLAIKKAAQQGYLDVVKYLVEQEAPIDEDAIKWAARKGHLEVAKYLGGIIQ